MPSSRAVIDQSDLGSSQAAELELKLRLSPEAVNAVLRHPALAWLAQRAPRKRRLLSTYFDTRNAALANSGVALRLRRDGERWVQTLKGQADARSGGSLTARAEYEWPRGVTAQMPTPDLALARDTPWRRVLTRAARAGLAPRFTTDFERIEMPLAWPDGTRAALCVDIGAIHSPTHTQPLCEVELERATGNLERLFETAVALAASVPLAIETRSKAQRGYALSHPPTHAPVRADAILLDRSMSAADALAATLRNCLRQIEGNADGLRADDDVEWVHQMRIGTRRLRACLKLLRGFLPPERFALLATEARWLADVLGTARDLDVMATQTLPRALRDLRDSPAQTALLALATQVALRRHDARAAARAAVASVRFTLLVLRVAALAWSPGLGAAAGGEAREVLERPARKFAATLLQRRHRKLCRRGAGLPHASAPARHAARIAAKQLRYVTEYFADLFPRKPMRAYRRTLTALQDVLGEMNDGSVAVTLAGQIVGETAAATQQLRVWADARAATQLPLLDRNWNDFSKAHKFWVRD